jgi:hypothetical protein
MADMPRVGSPASEEHEAVSRPGSRRGTVRTAAVVVAFMAVFLTVGVPRFLAGDDSSVGSHGEVDFAKLCRDHGGTPSKGTGAAAEPVCTVRYGRNVYRMDAITPNGFDPDTASFQRQGCEEAQREQKAQGAGGTETTFVYHPTTGVCEHRP